MEFNRDIANNLELLTTDKGQGKVLVDPLKKYRNEDGTKGKTRLEIRTIFK